MIGTFNFTPRVAPTAGLHEGRRRFLQANGGLAAVVMVGALAGQSHANAPANGMAGAPVLRWPDVSLKGLQGQPLAITSGARNATFVDFWASWCAPCRLSFPWMNALHDRFGSRGLRIVAVNLDRRREDALRFLTAYPARFEIALDPASESAVALQIQAMPTSMLVGPEGIIRWTHKGFRATDIEMLERQIEEALR